MARDDTRRHGKAREGTGTIARGGHDCTGHEGTEYILLKTYIVQNRQFSSLIEKNKK